MQQLILKKDLEQSKIDALLYFLKCWDIEAEFKSEKNIDKKKINFSLSTGIWEDYNINSVELRKKAWTRKK